MAHQAAIAFGGDFGDGCALLISVPGKR